MARVRKGFDIDPPLKRKINMLAKRVGCPLNWNRKPGYAWDGKDVGCAIMDASNLIHDIAHYALATKESRKSIDFGLGFSPDTDVTDAVEKLIYNYKICGQIEAKASALGIYWEKKLGLPWESTADFHSWHDRGDLATAWKKLARHIKKYSLKGIQVL
jgi:elongation factor P hydroxylase